MGPGIVGIAVLRSVRFATADPSAVKNVGETPEYARVVFTMSQRLAMNAVKVPPNAR